MWKIIIFFTIYFLNYVKLQGVDFNDVNLKFEYHEDVRLSFRQTVNKYGYPFETHEVITEDGYILNVFRMPHGRNQTKINKHPVLITHGTSGSADVSIVKGPYTALAYYLADRGFDVWMINHRGSYYSQKHKFLFNHNINSNYWNFGWHEIGVYDYSATIDYILNKTGQEQLFYIGHSQGTTSYFALTVVKPEYNRKIKFAILMAPSVFLWHCKVPLVKAVIRFSDVIYKGAELIGLKILIPFNDLIINILRAFSGETTVIAPVYRQVLNFGSWTDAFDIKILPLLFKTCPYGVPLRTLAHYGQIADSGKFRYFNFGPLENLRKYGSMDPPYYNLSLSTAPIGIVYSSKDNLTPDSQMEDFKRTFRTNLKYINKIDSHENFTHIDFIIAKRADVLIYKDLVELFKKVINNQFDP